MPRTATVLISALMAGSLLPSAAGRGFRIGHSEPAPFSQAAALQEPAAPPLPVVMSVGGPALFVVGNTTLGAGDSAVKTRLESLGFEVNVMSASAVTSGDAYGHNLVVVSSTVSPSSVNTKFRDVEIPVMTWESSIFDDMKMTGTTSGTHFGTDTSESKVTIAAAGHPLAAGLTGGPTVANSATTYSWGAPPATAIKAATIFNVPGRSAVFAYEPGAAMVGMNAPARRVGFFLGDTNATTLNASGWALFDAAVTWASNKVATPYFSPWGGTFTSPPSVEILCDTPGAEIRYTTDGTVPSGASTPYTGPIPISTTTTLKARAFYSDWAPSDVQSDLYQLSYGTLTDPVLTPNGGSAVDSITASISADPGATVHYTTTGTDPDVSSPIYSGTLTFTTTTEVRARAFRTDYTPSATVGALFEVRPPAPTIDLASGTYPLGQSATVTANGSGVVLRYSINGSDPTESDPIVASGGTIPIGSFVLKVNAWRPGCSPSDSAQASYDVTGRITNGAVAAGAVHSLALRPDGTVLHWGYGIGNTPRLANGINSVKAIAAGSSGESYAVKTDGTVWTWSPGVLPQQKAGLSNIVRVSTGPVHGLALDSAGTLWAWGENADGQLGIGTTTSSATPVQVNLPNVTAISAGWSHSLAVTSDGQAWAWGSNELQKLGDGTTTSNQLLPVQVKDQFGLPFTGVAGVGAGRWHSAALTTSGEIWTWGSNGWDQLGIGQPWYTLNLSAYPRLVALAAGMRSFAAGYRHTLVAQLDGDLYSWGDNTTGQLGDGTTSMRDAPVGVAPNVLHVSAGESHSLALTADGSVLAWGHNTNGELGHGHYFQVDYPVPIYDWQWNFGTAAAPTFTPVPGSYPSAVSVTLSAEPSTQIHYSTSGYVTLASPVYTGPIALQATSTIHAIAWRPDANMSPVAIGTFNLYVATPEFTPLGGTFSTSGVPVVISCATPGATIRYTYDGAEPTEADPVIDSGATLSLTASGTLKAKAWKTGLDPSAVRTETYTINGTAIGGSISAGGSHSLARTAESVPWGWGDNLRGQVGDGSTTDRWSPTQVSGLAAVDAASAGASHSVGIFEGQVWSWGWNSEGQLGMGSSPTQSPVPVAVSGLTDVSMVDAGGNHTLALKNDGTVRSWGRNANGQLGDNSVTLRNTPVTVTGLGGVTITRVAAGTNHSLGLDSLGRVWAWGSNSNGQLGDNSTTQRNAPVLISSFGGSTVAAIAAGGTHSLALTTAGQVYAWGLNSSGQLGDSTSTQRLVPTLVPSLSGVTAIAAGGTHSLALKATGVVWSWGSGTQVGDGGGVNRLVPVAVQGGLTGVVQISAGTSHSLALTHDGGLWAWGANADGQLGDGTTTTRLLPVRVSGPNFNWQVGRPVFSPAGPLITSNGDLAVTLTCSTPGATIHYTMNGVDPVEADPSVPSGGTFTLTQSLTLKARAWAGSGPPSDVASTAYELKLPTPLITPGTGIPAVFGQLISATSANPTATLRYRTDGNTPTEADPIWPSNYTLVDSINLRVRGFKPGWTASNTATANYTAKTSPPDISLASGSYTGAQTVTLTTPITESRIHYSTTGLLPTEQDPFVLSGETVVVDRSASLRARVWRANWAFGDAATADYIITLDPAATPTFDPPGGSYPSTQVVTIASATAGATIRYTLDGTEPGPASRPYSDPIQVDGPLTLKAKAYRVDHPPSATGSASYAIALSTVAPPNFSLPAGVYANAQLVFANSGTPGALVRYTIDGSDPDAADPVFPPFGLNLTSTLHVKARAFKAGLPPSPVRQASYWIVGMVDAGGNHSLALRADGTLWSWGWNSWGQIGDGTSTNRLAPVRLIGPQVWRMVSGGYQYTLGLDSIGQVWAWGHNGWGQFGDGTIASKSRPTLVPGLNDVTAVSAGFEHSVALKADGTVWAWGRNNAGQLGNGTTTDSNVPVEVTGLTGVTSVIAGNGFSFALKTDGAASGTLFVWGSGALMGDGSPSGQGQNRLRPGAQLTNVAGIASGWTHGLARKEDGSLWTWGSDGVSFKPAPAIVSGIPATAAADGGSDFTVALAADGTAMSWGSNANGRLGRGTTTFGPTPDPVLNLSDAVAMSTDASHTLALRRDGSVMAWGYNGQGQIGLGSTTDQLQPAQVTFPAPLDSDPDGDGLVTAAETAAGCDPYNFDSNGDGLLDGAAVGAGLSCSDLDMDDDGVQNLLERTRGTDPFRPDTDDDGSNDQADCFPLDPTRWECPEPDPNDHTPPVITLVSPTNATLISSVP